MKSKKKNQKKKKLVEALKALKPEENEELESIKGFFAKKMRNIETKSEIDESKKWENKNKRRDLIYKTNKYKYDFQQYETIRSFSDSIFAGKINIDEAEMNQSNLLKNMVEFNEQSKLRKKEDKKKKKKK